MLTQALAASSPSPRPIRTLKANQNFAMLMQELSSTEDRIASARRYYNANVRELNTKVESVPSNIVAGMFNIGKEEYFEAVGEQREAPKVDFGQRDSDIPAELVCRARGSQRARGPRLPWSGRRHWSRHRPESPEDAHE